MKITQTFVATLLFLLSFVYASCATSSSTTGYDESLDGLASYYAEDFHGRKTSNGEVYDMHAMTAAHRTLPFNTTVRVTNLDNRRSVEVRINDRGPFINDRVIDLSLGAAMEIGLVAKGVAPVRIEILELGPTSTR